MKPIIELKNVSVCYDCGKSNEVTAIKDINLQIFEGEYIVFFGPSGCGKSTLLYTIAGLEKATKGEVMVCGNDLGTMHPNKMVGFYRDTIGMIFQAFYLVPHLSAKDNMVLSKMFSGVSVKEREDRAVELMAKFGITPYSDRKPSMMSGGQQQRTAIARALMNDPEIILADEPVGNLDSKNSEVVLELLAEINRKEKKTVIQVTHNARDTHYADRVFYIKDGVIERVVENTVSDKYQSKQENISEFEKLKQANPDLSRTRLQARLMMRSLIMPYDIDTEQKLEMIIEKYLKKEVSKTQLLQFIDDSNKGVGLYSQKARRITDLIDDSVKEIENFNRIQSSQNKEDLKTETEVILIRRHLLDNHSSVLTHGQIEKLDSAINSRIKGSISEKDLQEMMDKPEKLGGVGLNRLTAKKFSKEIEIVISK